MSTPTEPSSTSHHDTPQEVTFTPDELRAALEAMNEWWRRNHRPQSEGFYGALDHLWMAWRRSQRGEDSAGGPVPDIQYTEQTITFTPDELDATFEAMRSFWAINDAFAKISDTRGRVRGWQPPCTDE
jgi:hypothetical protein